MSFNKDRRFNDNSILTREECIEIYRRTTMGKRVAESLVNFAMSVEREINIQEAEPEVVEEFKKVSKELKQDNSIKSTLIMSRVMGVAGLFVAIRDKETLQEDHKIVPTFNEIDNYDIKFNVMDKLPLSGTVIETRPLSFNFLDIKKISIGTNTISKKRIALSMPNTPIYLENTSDLIPYSAPSVYYNMVRLLDEYEEAIYCLSILLYKAGVITYKYEPNGKMAGVKIDAEMRSKEIIDQIRNGQVLAVSNKTDLVDFPINNVSGLIQAIDKLEEAITKALNDTPASILFDKNLSHGLSEGTEDMKSVIMAIESFREEKLKPLYNLTDFYVMLVAWNNAFTKEIQLKYPEKYAGWTLDKMRRSWVESFSFEFGNLFPEPESEKLRKNSMYLDNLLKVKQLGGLTSDIQAELNESKIFNNDIELDETQAQNMGMESSFDSGGFEKQGFNKPPQVDSIGGLKVDDAEFEEEHPRDEDGKFVKGNGKNNSKEIQEKIDKLKSIDWGKDNTLPNFPKSFLEEYELEDKPILLKKNIIDRNFYDRHKDIDKEKAIKILGNALYKTNDIFYGREDRPNYYNFIHYADDGRNDLVLVEIEDTKENYEIVHFYRLNKRGLNKLKNQTKKL